MSDLVSSLVSCSGVNLLKEVFSGHLKLLNDLTDAMLLGDLITSILQVIKLRFGKLI